jgi:hypothetical protein
MKHLVIIALSVLVSAPGWAAGAGHAVPQTAGQRLSAPAPKTVPAQKPAPAVCKPGGGSTNGPFLGC